MSDKLLIVEDDAKVSISMKKGLTEAGYEIFAVPTAEAAQSILTHESISLIVLDLGLPKQDGLDFLKDLRRDAKTIPVLIVTARDTVPERVKGLESGGDDYLIKPFAFTELLARIRALLRRRTGTQPVLRVADLDIDVINRIVTRAGRSMTLTIREFDLLVYLAKMQGQVVSREMLARDVWKETNRATPLDNVIDVHISHLRDKVDQDSTVKLIQTIRGVGYILRTPT